MDDYREAFTANPEYLLALMFSAAPSVKRSTSSSVLVEFEDDAVTARVQRASEEEPLRLLASKDTIYSAILLHYLIAERGAEFLESLPKRMGAFVEANVQDNVTFRPAVGVLHSLPFASQRFADTASFFESLQVTNDETGTAWSKTQNALIFLESEGLALDPVATATAMVLFGLIPVRFSIRTPKGERVFKQIHIGAASWSLDLQRGMDKGKSFTDFDFKFRGIQAVKTAILTMATQFVDSEEHQRRNAGKPTLPNKSKPDLDP